jgi:hypothetical protein
VPFASLDSISKPFASIGLVFAKFLSSFILATVR